MGAYDLLRIMADRKKDAAILLLYVGHFAFYGFDTGHNERHL